MWEWVLVGKPERTGHQKKLHVSGKVMLRWIIDKHDRVIWTDSFGLGLL
jgi:hypothetical protein